MRHNTRSMFAAGNKTDRILGNITEPQGKMQDDRTLMLETGVRPQLEARCPGCDDSITYWRGPHPRVCLRGDSSAANPVWVTPDPPVVDNVVQGPRGGEIRTIAAERLYKIADVWANLPMPMINDTMRLWQPALCSECEIAHQRKWLDAAFPPAPEAGPEGKSGGGWR